jgi:hypothetical protein
VDRCVGAPVVHFCVVCVYHCVTLGRARVFGHQGEWASEEIPNGVNNEALIDRKSSAWCLDLIGVRKVSSLAVGQRAYLISLTAVFAPPSLCLCEYHLILIKEPCRDINLTD